MTTLVDVEAGFWALTLGERDGPVWDGVPVERQRLYRSLVRHNLKGVLQRACPHAQRIVGEAAFDVVTNAFLASHRIQTRLTRDIPGEFTAWLQMQLTSPLPSSALAHHDGAAFAELCHFEALEIEITLAATATPAPGRPVDNARIVMDTSARLAVYRHPVHTVRSTTTTLPPPTPMPSVLLCFQRAEAFTVDVIAPAVGKLLMLAASGATVGEALATLAEEAARHGVSFDRGRLKSSLVQLHLRGAIAAFST
jgi:hypothetical protein